MTKVTISGNSNGNGNVNFAAPNTNSAITVTLPSSNVDMDNLGPSTTYGAVGTYILGTNYGSGTFTPGNDKSASSINLNASDTNGRTGYVNLSGTWRQMGHSEAGTVYNRSDWTTTVWLRIA